MSMLVALSCLTLCYPMDCSPPGFSIHQEFSKQEFWSGFPFPSPRDLPDPKMEPGSPVLQADSLPLAPRPRRLKPFFFYKWETERGFTTQEDSAGSYSVPLLFDNSLIPRET